MKNEFTAEIHREGEWFVAFCRRCRGQLARDGRRRNAAEPGRRIELVFEDRRATSRQQRHPQTEEAIVAIG